MTPDSEQAIAAAPAAPTEPVAEPAAAPAKPRRARTNKSSVWGSLLARKEAGKLPRTVIVGNPEKPSTEEAIERVRQVYHGRVEIAARDLTRHLQSARDCDGVDFFTIIGGDGTLLGAARALQFRQVPLVGIHLGHLGFLTAFTEEEFPSHMDALLAGKIPVDRRITLECKIKRGKAAEDANLANPGVTIEDFSEWAINECALMAGAPFKMIRMRLYVNEQAMTEVMGDGLIVATPGGSTAYNLSAGGPLVGANVKAIVITPTNPHSITHKPAVVEESSVIDVIADRVNPGTTCLLDGQTATRIYDGDRIQIRRGKYELLLARNPAVGEWQALQERLHWGRMPTLKEVKGKRS